MPGCPYFIANTFAHLFGGIIVTGLSTENPVFSDLDKKPISQFVLFLCAIFLLFVLLTVENGPMKYVLFIIFYILLGQTLVAFVKRLRQENVLSDTLGIVGAIFIAMLGLGIYDKNNMLGWGTYLFAGLIGLIVASIIGVLFGKNKNNNVWLSRFAVLLFTLYIGYDVQVLKVHAKQCRSNPDYISESINLYLDLLNLFTGVGDSFNN